MTGSGRNGTRALLAAILAVAALLRIHDLNWDESQHTHPDERWIAMVAPTIRWPEDARDLLDPRRSTLNPLWVPDGAGGGQLRNFAYGHLPLYLHALAGHSLASLGDALARRGAAYQDLAQELRACGAYDGISLVGRGLSVLFDLGTIALLYAIGRRVYGMRTALLGAALGAVAVTHIQLAHYATFDVITTTFITLAVYGAICVAQAQGQPTWPTVWAGAATGLAVASKFSAAPLIAALLLAHVVWAARRVGADAPDRPWAVLRRAGGWIALGLLVAVIAFLLTSPFAVLDWQGYAKQIGEQGAMVRGDADWPFTRQYTGTTSYLYQIVQQVRWGLGWPLGIAAFAGLGWTVVRQFRRARGEEVVLLGWVAPYFLLTGAFMVKFMRYMLPLLPLLVLFGAEMLWRIADWARGWIRAHAEQGGRAALRRVVRHVLAACPYLVLAGTALWALAFMRVYAGAHTWVRASRWIYANVPDGAVIAVEHWDDHLPLSLPEQGATVGERRYVHVELPMYEPDSVEKMAIVGQRLRQAEYIVLASNRLYRTIPRLPDRYPASSRFYELLFAEQFGYVREIDFTSYPGILGIEIPDDDADESFTVYDHPKPIVFRKVRDMAEAEWLALYTDALAQAARWTPEKEGVLSFLDHEPPQEGEESRSLLLDVPVGELPVVADAGWNAWASESTVAATLLWWVVVSALGWLAWPLTFVVFRGLRDRGYLLARSVGLLVVGYAIWLPASLRWLANDLPLTIAAIAALGGTSVLLSLRYRDELGAFLRERWRVVVLGEAVFGLAYLAFVGIRILNPDLWQPWQGGEKLMDIAYLNACLRSAHLPPYDPYYAHGYLNYYYYGQFLMSIVARVTGIRATVAFNLAVPTLFALTVCNAFSIGYALAGRVLGRGDGVRERAGFGIAHGTLAVLCVTVFGNLASAVQVVERLGTVGGSTFTSQIPGLQPLVRAASGAWQIVFHSARFPGFNYWDPSRVVGYTINEFPYWSFLFADLHPHMMNIPFTLLVIAVALNWLLRQAGAGRQAAVRCAPALERGPVPDTELALVRSSVRYLWPRIDWGLILNWAVWPIALGALAAINTWDWPAYAGLSGLVLLIAWIRGRGRQGVVPALLASLALAGGSLVLYWPFFKTYTALYVGLGWGLSRGYTALGEFVEVWGFVLYGAVTLLCIVAARRSGWPALRWLRLGTRYLSRLHRVEQLARLVVRPGMRGVPRALAIASIVLILVLVAVWRGYWVLALMVPLLALAVALVVEREMPPERRFVLALIGTGFLLMVGVELFYLKDHLAGDQVGWWRMNTLFKFYLQVWIMLGVAVGAALPEMWRAVERWRPAWRALWTGLLGLLLVSVLLFPLLGTPARVMDRFPGARPPLGTLDGLAFMTVGRYTWPNDGNEIVLEGDYRAIRWLQENVRGTPVLVEAPIGYYREFGGRVSSYTGLPALYNEQHEREQRYAWQNARRSKQVDDLFMSADLEETVAIARQLHVEYVYIGPLERTLYPRTDKFDLLVLRGEMSIAYQNEQVTIYRLLG
ncbi:MAG: glycosyltransferase family 39 protein [Anaerolineae bacterium]|nr:glycosyltransferase family 39 protein [Anaerolineae bacterium]